VPFSLPFVPSIRFVVEQEQALHLQMGKYHHYQYHFLLRQFVELLGPQHVERSHLVGSGLR
jgi:hypothetical protein